MKTPGMDDDALLASVLRLLISRDAVWTALDDVDLTVDGWATLTDEQAQAVARAQIAAR